jgi:hypothetical protein
VEVRIGAAIGGNINRQSGGTFRATVNGSNNTITFENLSLNFLANGPAVLPVSITLAGQSFRTRNPNSTYILPSQGITLPIGTVNLSQFTAVQTGVGAGVLTPTGVDTYDFTAGVLVDLTLAANLLGNPLAQTIPFVLPLQGQVVVQGNSAVITSLQQLNFSQAFNPNLDLPPFEFGLPTILPPGSTANLIFDLTLEEIGFEGGLGYQPARGGDTGARASEPERVGAGADCTAATPSASGVKCGGRPCPLPIPMRGRSLQLPPLLQVPPASRGEPRTGSVPPACRGNLKEGVLVYPYFCELWLGDGYYND